MKQRRPWGSAPATRALWLSIPITLAIAGCDDPGPPPPTPDRDMPATTHTVREWDPPEDTTTTTAAPATTTTSEPAPTASEVASSEPAPSASASAKPASKGFAFPSPKSGILTTADADRILKTGAKTKVRLIDPGKEPLSKLVYTANQGDSQALRVDLEQKVTAVVEGQTAPVLSPPQSLDVDVRTDEVDATTGALVTLLLKRMTLKPLDGIDADSLAELQKQLSGLHGYALRERVSPLGEPSDAKIQLPPSAPKGSEMFVTTMNDVFRAMLPSLPEEAVGIGAKWQSLSREDRGGANVMQLAEYTLKERSGTKLTLGYSARQLAAGDQIKLPIAAPEGTTTQLTRFVSTTSGSLVVDTREMAPIKGRSTQDTKVGIDVAQKGQAKRMSTETSMKVIVSFARRGGAPAGDATATPTSAPTAAPTSAPKDAPAKP